MRLLGAGGTLGIAPKSLQRHQGAPAPDHQAQPGGQPGADDRRGECLPDRMGDVLPSCTLAQRAARPRWLAAPQAALRAAQAVQAAQRAAALPVPTRGLAAASPRAGLVRQRLVVLGQLATSEDCYGHRLVRRAGTDQSISPPSGVERAEKPPWCAIRTPGGVRGGDREEPPYSILPWAPAFAGVSDFDMSDGSSLPDESCE
jgi:hypothetical protein